jgi:hypothetical protein
MVIADAQSPGWLHTLGQIAGTILLVELLLVLVIVAALMVGFAVAAVWVHRHVVPVLREYTPRAQQAMSVAQTSSDKVVRGIAEFYGRRQAVETGVRVLLFGKQIVRRAHEDERIHVAEEMQRISAGEEPGLPGPENGYTPHPHRETDAAAAGYSRARAIESDHDDVQRPLSDTRANGHTGYNGHTGDHTRADTLAGNAG